MQPAAGALEWMEVLDVFVELTVYPYSVIYFVSSYQLLLGSVQQLLASGSSSSVAAAFSAPVVVVAVVVAAVVVVVVVGVNLESHLDFY